MSYYILFDNRKQFFQTPFATYEEADDYAQTNNIQDYEIVTEEQLKAMGVAFKQTQQQSRGWRPYSHPPFSKAPYSKQPYSHPNYRGP